MIISVLFCFDKNSDFAQQLPGRRVLGKKCQGWFVKHKKSLPRLKKKHMKHFFFAVLKFLNGHCILHTLPAPDSSHGCHGRKIQGTVKVQTPFNAKICVSSRTTLGPSFSLFIKKEKGRCVNAWSTQILRELKRHCKTWSLYFRLQYVCT